MGGARMNRKDIAPKAEPAPTPLVSSADLDVSDYPNVNIPDSRRDALTEHARRISDNAVGSYDQHLTGLLGEDALARYLNIADELDVEIYPDGGDGGVDLCYQGATIDVKTVGRHRTNPALTVDAYRPLNADYYVLVSRIGPCDFRLVGYTPRWFVANAPVWKNNEGGQYHMIGQDYLFPFSHYR